MSTLEGAVTMREFEELVRDLRDVRRRGVRHIEGSERLPALRELPILERLCASLPDRNSASRTDAIRKALFVASHYVQPGVLAKDDWSSSRRPGEVIRILFGLDPSLELKSASQLSTMAASTIPRFKYSRKERDRTAANQISAWRARMARVLARAVLEAAEHEFAMPMGRINGSMPTDVPLGSGLLVGRSDLISKIVTEEAATIVITGAAGIGKSSLAAEVLRIVSQGSTARTIDLHGYSQDHVPTPVEALRRILELTGFPTEYETSDIEALTSRYRLLLSVADIVILLDNVANGDLAVRLLPGDGAKARVIMTSRDNLQSVEGKRGVKTYKLKYLTNDQSLEMLRFYTKSRSIPDGELKALLPLCAGLPFALSIVGATLATRPQLSAESLAAQIQASGGGIARRIYAPDVGVSVAQILEWSVSKLKSTDVTFLRVLVNLPVDEVTLSMLHALDLGDWERSLQQLLSINLVEERELDRYWIHQLTIDFARTKSGPDLSKLGLTPQRLLGAAGTGLANNLLDHSRRYRSLKFDDPTSVLEDLSGEGVPPAWAFEAIGDANNAMGLLDSVLEAGEIQLAGLWLRMTCDLLATIGLWEVEASWLTRLSEQISSRMSEMSGLQGVEQILHERVSDAVMRQLLYAARSGWHERMYPLWRRTVALLPATHPLVPTGEDATSIESYGESAREMVVLLYEPEQWDHPLANEPIEVRAVILAGDYDPSEPERVGEARRYSLTLEQRGRIAIDRASTDAEVDDAIPLLMAAAMSYIQLRWTSWDAIAPMIYVADILSSRGDDIQPVLERVRWMYTLAGLSGHAYHVSSWIDRFVTDASDGPLE